MNCKHTQFNCLISCSHTITPNGCAILNGRSRHTITKSKQININRKREQNEGKIDRLNLMKSHHRQCTASTLMYGNHKYKPRTEHRKLYHRLASSFQFKLQCQNNMLRTVLNGWSKKTSLGESSHICLHISGAPC